MKDTPKSCLIWSLYKLNKRESFELLDLSSENSIPLCVLVNGQLMYGQFPSLTIFNSKIQRFGQRKWYFIRHCKRKGNQSVTKLKLTPVFQSGKTCIILDKLFVFSFTDLQNVWWRNAPCAIIPVNKPRWEMKIVLFGLPPEMSVLFVQNLQKV